MSFQDFDGSARRPAQTTKGLPKPLNPNHSSLPSSAAGSAEASQHWDEGPSLHMAAAESECATSFPLCIFVTLWQVRLQRVHCAREHQPNGVQRERHPPPAGYAGQRKGDDGGDFVNTEFRNQKMKDTPEHRARLHLSIEQTKKLAQDTRALLHRMGSMGGYQDTGDPPPPHPPDASRMQATRANGTSSASWATTCSACSRVSETPPQVGTDLSFTT
jgi:hypothetical protein